MSLRHPKLSTFFRNVKVCSDQRDADEQFFDIHAKAKVATGCSTQVARVTDKREMLRATPRQQSYGTTFLRNSAMEEEERMQRGICKFPVWMSRGLSLAPRTHERLFPGNYELL